MTNKTSYKKNYLNQVVLAVILSGLGAQAYAADLTLSAATVTIGGQASTVTNQGLATRVTGIAASNYGMPDFTFTLAPSGFTDGTYKFKMGIVFDDDNSNNRVEVFVPSLELTITNNAVTSSNLDLTQKIRVLARNNDGSINVNAQFDPVATAISTKGNLLSISMENVVTAAKSQISALTALLNGMSTNKNYTYTIAMQETTSAGIRLGVGSPFTALPRFQTTCAEAPSSQSNNVFTLGSGTLASNLTLAYAVRGQFSVTGATGTVGAAPTAFTENCVAQTSGGGGTTTPPATETAVADTNNAIDAELNNSETVSTATVDALNTAADNAATLASNTAAEINSATTLSPTQATTALNTLTTVSKSVELAGTATQKNGAIDTSKAASTITNLASTLEAINTKSTTGGVSTLTPEQKTQVNTLVTNVVKDAANLIATGASSTNILSVVNASIKVIAQGAKANGGVTAEVVTQVKTLTEKAVSGVIKNLSTTQLAGADTSTPAGLKALMVANPSVLEVALAASANLPAGTSVSIGGVSLTVEEILALNLGGAGQTTGLQGGFNFQAATTGFTVTTDSTTGNMTLSNGTEKYVAANPVSRLVPDSVPEGISYLANGTAVLVGNGVATELAPTAFDQTAFSNAVTSAGFQVTYRSNGSISIALAGNERFSGAFAYDNLGTATSCGAVSVTAPTGNPAAADYAFMVKCADGVTQRVTPIADNASFYATLANADLNASTNRNTGVITIKTVGSFKPSFFVTPLSLTDTTFYNANKNADGIAFRASDKNGDGKTDYEVLSADGVQVLYGQ